MNKLYGSGNDETSSVLPNLSDDQIDNLYEQMIVMDGKFDAFKGDKREYVATVYSKMKEFLEQSNLKGGSKEKKKEKTLKEKIGIPEVAVKGPPEKRPKKVKVEEGDMKGEEVVNPFAFQFSNVSMQDILDTIKDYKDELEPLRNAMIEAFNSESQAEQHLFYFFKAPKLGNFENGPELKEAVEQRRKFFDEYGNKIFNNVNYNEITEGGTLLEVYTYESGLTKDYSIEVSDPGKKRIELIQQQVISDAKFAKMDFAGDNNTLEVKASFNGKPPYSQGHKLLSQVLSLKMKRGKNYHLFHIVEDSPSSYINNQFDYSSNKAPDFTFDMNIKDFINEVGDLPVYKGKKKTESTIKDKIFSVTPDEVLYDTYAKRSINGILEKLNIKPELYNRARVLEDSLIGNGLCKKENGILRFNTDNEINNKIIKFKKGKKKVKSLVDAYKNVRTFQQRIQEAEFID